MTTPTISTTLTENPLVHLTEHTSQEAVHATAEKVSLFTQPTITQTNDPLFLHLPTPQETFPVLHLAQSLFGLPSPMSEDPLTADLIPDFPIYSSQNPADDSDEEIKSSPPKKTKFDTPSRGLQMSSPAVTPARRARPVKLSFSSPQTSAKKPDPTATHDSNSEEVDSSPPKKPKFDTPPGLLLQASNLAETETRKLQHARLGFLGSDAPVFDNGSENEEFIPIQTTVVERSESDSGDEIQNSPPKKINRSALPRAPNRPSLKLQVGLSSEALEAPCFVPKNTEEFGWINRLVEPRVLGRDLNEREKLFVKQVYEAVSMGQEFPHQNVKIGIKHLQRGTYFIRYMHKALFELLSNPTVAGCIAEYYSNDRASLETLLNANIFPIGVFKPADEVRGAPNEKKGSNNPAKQGVPSQLEIFNELVTAGLSDLEQIVVGMPLTDPHFYDQATNDAQKTQKTKFGAAISFLPMTSLTKVSDTTVLNQALSTLPVEDFQAMAIMDISLCNADRNIDNIMLSTNALERFTSSKPGVNPSLRHGELCPIDHANILPAGFTSPANFAWMKWEIANRPFTESAKQKIASLNAQEDIAKIVNLYPNYPEANLEILEITYNLLKQAANDFTPFQIGLLFAAENENPSFIMNIFLAAKELQASMPSNGRPTMSDLMMPCIMKALSYATKYDLNNSREVWDSSFLDVVRKAKKALKQ